MTHGAVVLVDCAPTLEAAGAAGWLARGSLVVATTKYGVYACREAGVPYRLIDSFCDGDESTGMTLAAFRRLETFCAEIDRRLWTWHDDLRGRIRPFGYAYYELKILVDTISVKLLQLKRMVTHTRPASVVYRSDPLTGADDGEWPFEERRNLYADLLETTTVLAGTSATAVPLTAPPSLELRAAAGRSVPARVRQALESMPRSIRRALTARRRRHFVLFSGGGHDIKYLLPVLARLGYAPVRIRPGLDRGGVPRAPFAETWRRLSTDDAFVAFFSCLGVSYFPVVRSRLQRLVTELAPASIDGYAAAKAFLKQHETATFALTSFVTVAVEQRGQMDACRDAGCRVVTYQEGAGFGSVVHPMNDYGEMTGGDDFLCYGEGNLEYHDELVAAGRPVRPFHVVGSAEQDAARSRLRSRTISTAIRSVTYVSTWIAANRQHHPFNGGTDSVYGDIQLTLLDTLHRLARQIVVKVKPHPTDTLPMRYFSARGGARVQILSGVLEEVLDDTDLFIVDFPSTTLLSCCQTGAHIFVLADPRMIKFTDVQLRRLERRAFVFFDTASLVDALQRLETQGFQIPDIRRDDDYVRKYASHLSDGGSAERAAALLDQWENGILLGNMPQPAGAGDN